MRTETTFEYMGVRVELQHKIFVCTVNGMVQKRTGSYLLAKEWYFNALRSISF